MCGIWAFLSSASSDSGSSCTDEQIEQCLAALGARGPESVKAVQFRPNGVLGFTRLAINDVTAAGMQPLTAAGCTVVCNGEIYNHAALEARHGLSSLLTSGSDCEVLPHLFSKFEPTTVCRTLDGVFALVVVFQGRMLVARDPLGVRPLYYAATSEGVCVASELKGILPHMRPFARPFPPGHYHIYDAGTAALLDQRPYTSIPHVPLPLFEDWHSATLSISMALEHAVEKRLMSDRPMGCLLSGGLDSSVITSCVVKLQQKCGHPASSIHTFSIGMEGSSDLQFARTVADALGTTHHEIVATADEFFEAIPAVIAAIESYDITTVRASVGNYLVGKYIREHTDIKVVFNGDGSDEVSGSYLYFYNAPTDEEYDAEVHRLLTDIHNFDVLRSDRCMAAHGLEARTPFLDKQYVATYLAVPVRHRRPVQGRQVEKALLRDAFLGTNHLPTAVVTRRKEAFSDGVSSTERPWYAEIQMRVGPLMEGWETQCGTRDHCTPFTAEALYYRKLFEDLYGDTPATTPYFWMPKWSGNAMDPSARTLAIYQQEQGQAVAAT